MPSSNYNKVFTISDCHLHSDFSSDSSAAPRDIIERAISLGLRSICFTDHSGKELDLIIGSSHLVNGADPYYPSFWEGADVQRGILSYYESILENLEACFNFDVYGHIDYIVRYIPKERADEYRESDYYEILDAILRSIIAHEKGIEINTAGFKYKLNRPNPSEFIIKRYRELGGEIITVGSDAHEPEYMAYCFDKVPDILKAAGFKYYTRFIKRAPEFISLG